MLKELDMTYDEFVDLCILCGCDYVQAMDGIDNLRIIYINLNKVLDR